MTSEWLRPPGRVIGIRDGLVTENDQRDLENVR